ncbi:hypothetical protein AMATHDRAFT_69742 [Amanita thiersii Skay4041]|uniref:Phosphatidylserine decarboxylase proenzyme 1, mitochondrial n=1 Tax=Amanita thiersii Skay4041 TaxID=703135 RepID=A0A2A9NFS2_9AGAR|nr:hypothetical protein AMATHDRAFT_69742 [Amanita thiersii Skay4041]
MALSKLGIGRRVRRVAYYSTGRAGDSVNTSSGGGAAGAGASSSAGMASGMRLPFYRKLINAWTETPTKWYPLPLAVGALLLVALQYRKKVRRAQKEVMLDENGVEVVKLKGPWHVHVLGALPLRNMSRLWGYVNSLELPVWFRPYGFKLYAYAFGCNLDEIEPRDLRAYPSLGDFFYRKLRDGVRPVDDAILVSPADGTILHFGAIKDLRVEQVKGITYSLDAFIGVDKPGSINSSNNPLGVVVEHNPDMTVVDDREFANVNGIEYSLGQLIGGGNGGSSGTNTPVSGTLTPMTEEPAGAGGASDGDSGGSIPRLPRVGAAAKKFEDQGDVSVVEPERSLQETLARDVSVAKEMMGTLNRTPSMTPTNDNDNEDGNGGSSTPAGRPAHERKHSSPIRNLRPGHSLFFTVVYLAPGDYHRFHSPTAWVVEKRRHFVGELFSVSPWMAKRLEGLFVLNERVALLGRWRYGFFGMVPVGATNVGSIHVNFDKNLRTNVRGRRPPPGRYSEAVYSGASVLLGGQPLERAQEMGGFRLGSTVVLVFEAPTEEFEFKVRPGEKVKVGQKLGDVRKRAKVE